MTTVDGPFGATPTGDGVMFRVFSSVADGVDLCLVADDGTERLLPFVAAVVLAVEKEAGQIRVEWGSDW